MWGYVREETREIDGNTCDHGPGYDRSLITTQKIKTIEIFETQDHLLDFLKQMPSDPQGKGVQIYEMKPVVAHLKLDVQSPPVYRRED